MRGEERVLEQSPFVIPSRARRGRVRVGSVGGVSDGGSAMEDRAKCDSNEWALRYHPVWAHTEVAIQRVWKQNTHSLPLASRPAYQTQTQ